MTHGELLDKWGPTVDLSGAIFTWTERLSLCYVAEIASTADTMIECGTYHGRSAKVIMDAGCHHLWCIDVFQVPGDFECASYFLRKEIADGRCELIKGNSDRGSGMLQHMKGKIDAVWVDDGHATEEVKRDISNFLPLLKPGGVLFGHDFDVPHNDVALGVIASLPSWDIPVPRVWSYRKP